MAQIRNPTKIKLFSTLLPAVIAFALTGQAADIYVAVNGSDGNTGTAEMPFRTIQHAADAAQPGDVITVRAGIYRESVNPPRGGVSDSQRIIYQAAPGENVVITGSQVVTNWTRVRAHVWKATLPNSFFGDFNPYTNVIHGDWFSSLGRVHHTGAVYLNGNWLTEAETLDDLIRPMGSHAVAQRRRGSAALPERRPLWFARVDGQNTTILAQFKIANPNQGQVEINARQTVFYPRKTGINYLTVRGFTLEDAATPWCPPTAEQIGLIGTHWSRGWIIESNIVRYSMCAGVSLGKYGDEWDNRAGTATGYVGTIRRALTNGWNEATIGRHIVRGNDISHCEQVGVVGSLGGAFSTISGNNIHDINVMKWFSGAEIAGIKLHGAIDVTIGHNHIHHCYRGIWLDWMAQGTRVTGNLFHDNGSDIFFEVDHGPFLADNNIFLSRNAVSLNSQGGAFVHNLFAGSLKLYQFDARQTPFLKAHSTALAGFHNNPSGDVRFYNNLFVRGADMSQLDKATLPVMMNGNVYLNGAKPARFENNPLVKNNWLVKMHLISAFKLSQRHGNYYLRMEFDKAWMTERTCEPVTSELLGKAVIPDLAFEQPDGEGISISTDYFGNRRNDSNPTAGPFERQPYAKRKLEVW
jgi:alpha-N-arabinofuranosidase